VSVREGGIGGLINASWGVGRHPCPMAVCSWKWAGARAFNLPHRREGQVSLGRVHRMGRKPGGLLAERHVSRSPLAWYGKLH